MNYQVPKVSVAVVTYNQLPLLKECVASVIDQDYPNIELVVADDGSTDGTREWLEKELSPLAPIQVVVTGSKINAGITRNCNAALRACSGQYIAWLGGDDLMLPGKLRKQVEYMESHPAAALSFHDLEVFDSDTGVTLYRFSNKSKPREGGVRTAIRWGSFNGACSTMVRSGCCPEDGFDERLPVASDWLFWVQSLKNGGQIGYIPQVLGKYRRHAGNVTGSDPNRPAVLALRDHMTACGTILVEYPEYVSDIFLRMARLLLALRFAGDGSSYRRYVVASLRSAWTIDAVGALAVNMLTGRRI